MHHQNISQSSGSHSKRGQKEKIVRHGKSTPIRPLCLSVIVTSPEILENPGTEKDDVKLAFLI